MSMFLSRAFQWYQQCNKAYGRRLTYLNVTNKLPFLIHSYIHIGWECEICPDRAQRVVVIGPFAFEGFLHILFCTCWLVQSFNSFGHDFCPLTQLMNGGSFFYHVLGGPKRFGCFSYNPHTISSLPSHLNDILNIISLPLVYCVNDGNLKHSNIINITLKMAQTMAQIHLQLRTPVTK